MNFSIYLIFLLYINNSICHQIQQNHFKQINQTHFECDKGTNILELWKINDDYCDCVDGSDETSIHNYFIIILETNACLNGKFFCVNRFYEPKLISTMKLNDGICDCCDGSDEFNYKCTKTCLEKSSKALENMKDNFKQLKYVVSGFDKNIYINYFEHNSQLITNIITSYEKLKILRSDFKLVSNYLNFVESTNHIVDAKIFIDSNSIITQTLISSLDKLYEKIVFEEKILKENRNLIDSMEKYSIIFEIEKDCITFNFSKYDCNLCTGKLVCNNKNKWNENKFLGNIVKFDEGDLILSNGSKCRKYNKNYSSRINIKCGNEEKIEFVEKINGCEYLFVYNTTKGCNTLMLRKMQKKISLYLGELN